MVLAGSGFARREEPLAGWFELPVPGGEATLVSLGLTLDERAFTLPILARVLHDRDQQVRMGAALARLGVTAHAATESITVPAPLTASIWRDVLPPVKPPGSGDLFARLVADPKALLLAYGLMATDETVRAFLQRDRPLLRFIYQNGAAGFALVARRLRVAEGRLVVPGGPDAEAAWAALAGVAPARTEPFLRVLLTKDHGRLAWYYDTIGALAPEQLAAAWPVSAPPPERATALYPAFRDPDQQWRAIDQPFRRGAIDAWMVVTQNMSADGMVTSPLPQATWELLFATPRLNDGQVARTLAVSATGESPSTGVSLPWLARETLSPVVGERRQRFEMFRLAQRVFAGAAPADWPDVVVAVNGVRQSRALVLALERMQIRRARTWAATVNAARHVSEQAEDRRPSIVIFQATLALLERMRHGRTLDIETTEQLLDSLADAVRADKRVAPSVARWLTHTLIPALPRLVTPDAWTATTAYESVMLQALAGPVERPAPILEWEGLTYRVDPVAAEHDRLKAMRTLLPSPGLDAALASGGARQLADALATLVYATALGDPEGPASLSPEVVSRHDFGFGGTNLIRTALPWAPPEERQGDGPWHVQGSLLGLDIGLSRLLLRRIADQQMPKAPTLTLNDLATLSRTVAGLVALDLRDADRDEIAAAIGRGRTRVARARTLDEWAVLAQECGMSESARQLLPWIASRQREVLPDLFALRDLLWLGHPALSPEVLDRWGAAAGGLDGRRLLAMPLPAPWEDYAGRAEVGQMTTQVPDLTLRLAEETATLHLSAALVPSLLAFALEDYWHEAEVRFADDWPRLTRQAAAVAPARIHDYVAALTGAGPLRAQ